MLEAQVIRRDSDSFAGLFPTSGDARLERLRQHFSDAELRLFGIDQAYAEEPAAGSSTTPWLRGLGAVLATVFLFVAVGYLATFGLADHGTAIGPVTATLA